MTARSFVALPAPLRHGSLSWLAIVAMVGLVATQALVTIKVLPGFCSAMTLDAVSGTTLATLQMLGGRELVAGWALMVVAMMPPLVSAPLNHVARSTLSARRRRAIVIFLASYGAIWFAAGAVMVPLSISVRLLLGTAAFPVTVSAALAWSCSPLAQVARNRCHRLVRVGLRGMQADADCARQAGVIAPWCVLSCSPWMLAVMTLRTGHVVAMALVTLVLVLDRMMPSAKARWQLPPAFSLVRRSVFG